MDQTSDIFGAFPTLEAGSASCNEATSTASSSSGTAKKVKVTNRMTWDNHKDWILIGEVILARTFQFRKGSNERGKAWQDVSNALKARDMKVDKRAVRDRITNVMDRVRDKNRKEKAATGIAVDETEEEKKIREAVEDLIQEEEDIEVAPREKGDEERKKAGGAEMRKQACETFGETQNRNRNEGSLQVTPKRPRNNGSETLALLHRKIELDQQARREEAERKREQEERRRTEELERERRNESFQQQMLLQQQQQQQQTQQQNQQMQAMMMALIKSLDKKN